VVKDPKKGNPFLGPFLSYPQVWVVELGVLCGVWYNNGNYMAKNKGTKVENGKIGAMEIVKKILKWTTIGIFTAFVLLVIARMPVVYRKQKTEEQVAKIHATKLTMDDVMGVNLPPDPGTEADKTVAGIDANKNGIRDDVELAIFEEYPNSAKTRAVLLQYALALQMELTQPFENEKNVTEVVREESRAHSCVADTLVPRKSPESGRTNAEVKRIDSFINFVEDKQFSTDERKKAKNDFYEKLRSFGPLDEVACDIDLSKLPN